MRVRGALSCCTAEHTQGTISGISIQPTFFLHVDCEALVEPAGLALVPPDDVHHAPAVVLAQVVQRPASGSLVSAPPPRRVRPQLTLPPAAECSA